MNILEYGSVIKCKNIVFEDDEYDIKGHPGVVILPTNEKQDKAICLYMTSNVKRKGKEDFYCIEKRLKKTSYVNIRQIIETDNIRKGPMGYLDDDEFIGLLESFYDYQINLDVKREAFKQIEGKIKILIEVLKKKRIVNINIDDITIEELDILDKIGNIERAMLLYGTKVSNHFRNKTRIDKEKLNIAFFHNIKEKNYSNALLEIYEKIKSTSRKNKDSDALDAKITEIYENDYNSVFNKNMLYEDLVILLKLDNNKILSNKIKKVINMAKDNKADNENKNKDEDTNSDNLLNQFDADLQQR